MTTLIGTYEILGAMIPTVDENQKQQVLNNVEASVNMVENTQNEINLTLPYYTNVEKISSHNVGDSDIDEVAGGEIFAILAISFGSVAIAGVGAGITYGVTKDK